MSRKYGTSTYQCGRYQAEGWEAKCTAKEVWISETKDTENWTQETKTDETWSSIDPRA